MTFEENLTRLNDIVGQLENDKLPLESAKLSVKAMNGDNSDE